MNLAIESDTFVITLERWEKFWAFHFRPIVIHRANIISVEVVDPEVSWKELRIPGTFLPGVLKAGTYLTWGTKEKAFWYFNYKNRAHTLKLTLHDSPYKTIYLTHPESEYWADIIKNNTSRHTD
jgi:hypothetical protein